jgi:hypothetical protein
VIGEGPKHKDGRTERTKAEQAIAFARQLGCREDAIKIAWERNRDRADTLETMDWVQIINDEAKRLQGAPRPEVVRKKQREIRTQQGKVEAKKRRARRAQPTTPPAKAGVA